MESLKLNTECRDGRGKGAARRLRAQGMVPGVIYSHKEDPLSVSIVERELRRVLASNWETAIVDVNVSGRVKKECNAIIKEVQQHPASGRILHVDFQAIYEGEKVRLDVPVTLDGDPRGVKEMGGILEHGSRELAIRCMPRHIPEAIVIDVSSLGIHDGIHIRDIIDVYPNVEFLDEPDTTLAIVVPPRVEVEPTTEVAEGEEEPEVIVKGKEDEAAEPAADKGES